jgi:hypothetical protein
MKGRVFNRRKLKLSHPRILTLEVLASAKERDLLGRSNLSSLRRHLFHLITLHARADATCRIPLCHRDCYLAKGCHAQQH